MEGDWEEPMKWFQKTGFAVGFVIIGLCLAGILLFPVLGGHPPNPETHCVSNLKQCMLGQLFYATDHDDRLPLSAHWMDAISRYVKPGVVKCPTLAKKSIKGYGYAMNLAMSRVQTKSVKAPEQAPVLFDSILLGRNASSGFYGFPDPKERKTNIAYLDGHAAKRKEEAK
jgi:prepilin-type processing-associated H-X9-DG protein